MKIKKNLYKKKNNISLFLLKLKVYLSDYILKDTNVSRQVLNLSYMLSHFKKCLRILYFFNKKKKHILFIGFSKKKNFLSLLSVLNHTYLLNTDLEKGQLTNPEMFYKKNIVSDNSFNTSLIKPDLIITLTYNINSKFILESRKLKIPVIAFFPYMLQTKLNNKLTKLVHMLIVSILLRSLKQFTLQNDKKKKI